MDAVAEGPIPSSSSSAPDGLRYYGGMAKEKPKPGPEAERLKVEGHWKQAVEKAVRQKRPKGGWPKDGWPKDGWPKDSKPSREDHGEGK